MNKRDYFIKALNSGACNKREWVNSIFAAIISPSPGGGDYPYRIVSVEGDNRKYFIDPANDGQLTVIEDSSHDEALCSFNERLVLYPGEIGNWPAGVIDPITTTYSRAFVNHLCLVIPFGSMFPYVNGHFDVEKFERTLAQILIDDPKDDNEPPPEGKVYVKQYLRFCDNALSLVAYNNLCVTSVSRKSLVSHPKARSERKRLVEKYKDRLTDPAIVARIGKELEDLDREWLKDDPSYNYYLTKERKLISAARKKMFYMFGGESPFEDGTTVEFIQKSLEEGIDIDHLPAMINSIRFGSYNRGAQTQLGGESTKTIYRMLGTVSIAEDDCGSHLGIPMKISNRNKGEFVGFYIREGNKDVLLTNDNIDTYVGKAPDVKGPLTCKTEGRNVCKVCAGTALAEQPNGLTAAAAEVGGVFLSAFLAMMHGKSHSTEKWDLKEQIR